MDTAGGRNQEQDLRVSYDEKELSPELGEWFSVCGDIDDFIFYDNSAQSLTNIK